MLKAHLKYQKSGNTLGQRVGITFRAERAAEDIFHRLAPHASTCHSALTAYQGEPRLEDAIAILDNRNNRNRHHRDAVSEGQGTSITSPQDIPDFVHAASVRFRGIVDSSIRISRRRKKNLRSDATRRLRQHLAGLEHLFVCRANGEDRDAYVAVAFHSLSGLDPDD
jgi:hypothetical protein